MYLYPLIQQNLHESSAPKHCEPMGLRGGEAAHVTVEREQNWESDI